MSSIALAPNTPIIIFLSKFSYPNVIPSEAERSHSPDPNAIHEKVIPEHATGDLDSIIILNTK